MGNDGEHIVPRENAYGCRLTRLWGTGEHVFTFSRARHIPLIAPLSYVVSLYRPTLVFVPHVPRAIRSPH